jgi:glycosyltransferase involved in cell wall biosynthesis
MANAGISLLKDPQLRSAMGKAARKHALRDFCATKIVKRYEDLYRETMESVSAKG